MAYIIHHVSIPEAIDLIREDCPTTMLDHAVLPNGSVHLGRQLLRLRRQPAQLLRDVGAGDACEADEHGHNLSQRL